MGKFFLWLLATRGGTVGVAALLGCKSVVFWPLLALGCHFFHGSMDGSDKRNFLFLAIVGALFGLFMAYAQYDDYSVGWFAIPVILYSVGFWFFVKEMKARNTVGILRNWAVAKRETKHMADIKGG